MLWLFLPLKKEVDTTIASEVNNNTVVVFTPQKGGRHNINDIGFDRAMVVFTPQKGGRHNNTLLIYTKTDVVFTPQKGGRHNRKGTKCV